MGFIFYLSSRSTAGIGHTSLDRFLILKSYHLIEYAVLAALIWIPSQHMSLTVLTSYLYAVSDEIHQSFTPGRSPRFTDTLIDLIGISLGLLIIPRLWHWLTPFIKRLKLFTLNRGHTH